MAVPMPMSPAMNFIEDEQWVLAIYKQNEVRKIKPGQEAEDEFQNVSGPHCKIQGRFDHVGHRTGAATYRYHEHGRRSGPIPPYALAVRLLPDAKDKDLFLAAGASGAGAVYTDSVVAIQILRRILLRVSAKLDWLILKLH